MTACGVCGASLETRGVIEGNPDQPRCPHCLRPELPMTGLFRQLKARSEAADQQALDSGGMEALERRKEELLAERVRRWTEGRPQEFWLAYGWNEPLGGSALSHWWMSPAGVFRPLRLWVWEPAEWGVLESVTVNGKQYLQQGLPLRAFIAPVSLEDYLGDVRSDPTAVSAFTSHRELGRPVTTVLETRETAHRLDCPTLGLGQTLELRFRGTVRALSLLGRGYPARSDRESGR